MICSSEGFCRVRARVFIADVLCAHHGIIQGCTEQSCCVMRTLNGPSLWRAWKARCFVVNEEGFLEL